MQVSHAPLRVVLLGASGFVGTALLRQMRGMACEAELLVHRTALSMPLAGAHEHRGRITDLPPGLLPDAPHVVIHCASKQVDADGSGFDVNPRGIEHLCERIQAQATLQTRAVLFVSSCSVYGDGPQRGVTEDAPLHPGTPLAQSRAACEALLAERAASHCRVEVFRPRFVLGCGDHHVLPGLARLARRGLTLGDGQQRFSVIDVDDLARILLARARHALQVRAPASFEVFNVGYERPITLNEIHRVLRERLVVPLPRHRIPTHPALLNTLGRLPLAPARRLAQRLRLLGLDHYGDMSRLKARLDTPWLGLDPRTAVSRATQWLPPHPEAHR